MLFGKGLVIGARGCSFTLFIVFNAVICTVGVFNLSLASEANLSVPVDGYLIFVSALALISIIPLIFIDMYVKDPFVCRLWVECAWVGIFWVMELVAAAAFSATVPNILCDPLNYPDYVVSGPACQSTHALQACTWLVMVVLFAYLTLLVSCGIRHERLSPNVWQTSVRHFPWFDANPRVEYPDPAPPYRQRRRSEPIMSPREMMQPPPLEAPRPRHAIPRLRLTIPTTVRDVMGRIGRPSPSPSIHEPQSAGVDVMAADPSANAPTVPPSRASRRSFLSFTRSRRSSRRPSARRPYDPESFYPEHLQAALSSIVYDGSTQQQPPPASLVPGRAGRRGSRPLPQTQAVAGPSSWQEPRPPVPPLPDLSSMSSRRPLPSPATAPLTAPLPAHIAPSRPQLTIDTSNSGLHPTPAPAFASSRRGSRPLPQLLHTKAAVPEPQPQPVAGPSRLNIPPPPPLRLPTPTFADPTPTSASISPLGDWPRTDVLSLPLRPRKRAPPPPPSSFPLKEETSASSHAPLLSTSGIVRRDSGGSEPTPTSSSAAHGTMGQPPSVGPSPRGSLSSRVVLPPRGPRTRQESLSSLNSVQLHNLVSSAYGQDHSS